MMQSHNADAEIVRQTMDRSQGCIVSGIAILSVDWPHVGQSIEQDQARLFGIGRPIRNVIDAASVEPPSFCRKSKALGPLHPVHTEQLRNAVLEPSLVVFQCAVENVTGLRLSITEASAAARNRECDVECKP